MFNTIMNTRITPRKLALAGLLACTLAGAAQAGGFTMFNPENGRYFTVKPVKNIEEATVKPAAQPLPVARSVDIENIENYLESIDGGRGGTLMNLQTQVSLQVAQTRILLEILKNLENSK